MSFSFTVIFFSFPHRSPNNIFFRRLQIRNVVSKVLKLFCDYLTSTIVVPDIPCGSALKYDHVVPNFHLLYVHVHTRSQDGGGAGQGVRTNPPPLKTNKHY